MSKPLPPCPQPPAQVAPFVQVLGIELAVRFLLAFGGAELSLSAEPRGRSQVEELVGRERAQELAQLIAVPRRIPLAKQWLAVYFRSRGSSVAEIARTLRASDVAVRGWLAKDEENRERLAEEAAARAARKSARRGRE